MKEITIETNIVINFKFWAVTPAININLHSSNFEIEWLCLGIYIGKKRE